MAIMGLMRIHLAGLLLVCGGFAMSGFGTLGAAAPKSADKAEVQAEELQSGGVALREGDVLFQAVPHNMLADTIQTCTKSEYTHCGVLARAHGEWVVIEGIPPVSKETPYAKFAARSRDGKVHAYRLKAPYRASVPAFVAALRKREGVPYDARFRMDDEKLYCSELIWKAWTAAGGKEPLGKPVKLKDMDWKPREKEIRVLEGGPPPLEREIISPVAVSAAEQLEKVGVVEIKELSKGKK